MNSAEGEGPRRWKTRMGRKSLGETKAKIRRRGAQRAGEGGRGSHAGEVTERLGKREGGRERETRVEGGRRNLSGEFLALEVHLKEDEAATAVPNRRIRWGRHREGGGGGRGDTPDPFLLLLLLLLSLQLPAAKERSPRASKAGGASRSGCPRKLLGWAAARQVESRAAGRVGRHSGAPRVLQSFSRSPPGGSFRGPHDYLALSILRAAQRRRKQSSSEESLLAQLIVHRGLPADRRSKAEQRSNSEQRQQNKKQKTARCKEERGIAPTPPLPPRRWSFSFHLLWVDGEFFGSPGARDPRLRRGRASDAFAERPARHRSASQGGSPAGGNSESPSSSSSSSSSSQLSSPFAFRGF